MRRLLSTSSRQCLPRGSLSPPRLPPSAARPASAPERARRRLVTLAIETSCDDTCVAVLERCGGGGGGAGAARLLFNEKVTADNRAYRGVHPIVAVVSHTEHLPRLVRRALRALPVAAGADGSAPGGGGGKTLELDGRPRLRPDFVSVTRGPGMLSNLSTGLNLAKGLALAWDVPLVAVNHMQAHALTPQLVSALRHHETGDPASQEPGNGEPRGPQFPFLSLLVSGGHTMLVRSNSLNDHTILANSSNVAVGDMLDKIAREVLPREMLSGDAGSSMYGPILEEFVFPGSKESAGYNYMYTPPANRGEEIKLYDLGGGWTLTPPLALKGQAAASDYDVSGLHGQVQQFILDHPEMDDDMRRILARGMMTLVFEHLTSRLVFALESNRRTAKTEGQDKINTVVLSGGVASNKFFRHIVRQVLDVRGHADVEVVAPPVALCTDNAAMIAWTGMEMYLNGWRSEIGVLALRKWPLDPNADGGGILEAPGWYREPVAG